MPRISVIVPAYNAESFLKKCIDSILSQTFTDFELIVVDDGSSDHTPEICDQYAVKDGRVRVLHQKNGGVSRARNAGLDAAVGELIAFADADDYLLPGAYEKMLDAMNSVRADTGMCNFSAEYPDGSLHPYGAHVPCGNYNFEKARQLIVIPLLCGRLEAAFNGFIWCYLFNRAAIEKRHIRFTGAYLEDELFLIEYFSIPGTLAVTDEALYGYFVNPDSITHRYMSNYTRTFKTSFEIKKRLVRELASDIPPEWEYSTLWAGLLIAVGNEFAPGNTASAAEKLKNLKNLCENSVFAEAVKQYKPTGMGRRKSIVAMLIRWRMYTLLSKMYKIKNRNRS